MRVTIRSSAKCATTRAPSSDAHRLPALRVGDQGGERFGIARDLVIRFTPAE